MNPLPLNRGQKIALRFVGACPVLFITACLIHWPYGIIPLVGTLVCAIVATSIYDRSTPPDFTL